MECEIHLVFYEVIINVAQIPFVEVYMHEFGKFVIFVWCNARKKNGTWFMD